MVKTILCYCFQYFYFPLLAPFIFLLAGAAWANYPLPDIETTRLKSTAGAGVASLLMDEATILNPAPLSFFQNGSFYFQRSKLEGTQFQDHFDSENSLNFENEQTTFVASDSKGKVNGSLSYVKQGHRYHHRRRLATSLAYPTAPKSSMGITYSHTKEKLSTNNIDFQEITYKQTSFGVIHALNNHFTLGLVVIDPMKVRPQDTRGIVGIQYVYQDFISLMFDFGADYNDQLDKTFLWRGATQIKLLQDFYLRTGLFNDRGKGQKGTGVGVGWIQPRLVMEFALKNTDILKTPILSRHPEKIKETSLSLSYRF